MTFLLQYHAGKKHIIEYLLVAFYITHGIQLNIELEALATAFIFSKKDMRLKCQ